MNIQGSHLAIAKLFLELLAPNISPNDVLKRLLSPSQSPLAYRGEDIGSFVKFCGYMKYIMVTRPDGHVDGIWEKILRKTIMMYSQNVLSVFDQYKHVTIINQICNWTVKVLSSQNKCPNVCLRLEVFRLVRIVAFKGSFGLNLDCILRLFMMTICEIHPVQMFPCDDVDKLLFDLQDFNWFILKLSKRRFIADITDKDFNMVDIHTNIDKFIPKFLKIVGLYASLSTNINDFNTCCSLLNEFEHIIPRPQFHNFVVMVLRELTAALFNVCGSDIKKTETLLHLRDRSSGLLRIYTKPSEMPRLLLSRQIQGPRAVRQHALLLKDLVQHYENENWGESVSSDDSIESFNSSSSDFSSNYSDDP